jgi:hypothetical protein
MCKRRILIVVTAALALVASVPCPVFSTTLSTPDEVVWHWFGQCSDARGMTAEVTLDSKVLYTSSFPICQMRRGDIPAEAEQRRLVFFLEKEKRSFFGEAKAKRLEGNIWEAGGDPKDIILGVSFATKDRIWLNTLHFVDPHKSSRSVLAKGLVIKTFPAQRRVQP